jgi:hypothetical protein
MQPITIIIATTHLSIPNTILQFQKRAATNNASCKLFNKVSNEQLVKTRIVFDI